MTKYKGRYDLQIPWLSMHDWVWISTMTFKMSASSDSFTTHEWLRNKNTKTLKQEWFLIEESINNNFRQLVVAIYLLYRCRVENPFAKIHSRKFSRYESSHQFFEVRVESPMFRSTSRVTKILCSHMSSISRFEMTTHRRLSLLHTLQKW